MRMILDIIRPDAGSISVFGKPPGVEHQSRIGYLPEDRGLYRDVPVVDTLAYFGALRGLSLTAAKRRATELLTDVGLGDALTKKGAELSRGMHQKAQLVATIINEPDLLIVDEPFSGPRSGQRRDAQGPDARATRPWRGRDHEHARHGGRAGPVRPRSC